jgi:Ca2+-binding RTX toxin-like protein
MGDIIYGGEDDDVVLGDNGEITREVMSKTHFPWLVHVWKRYPVPFDSERIRDVRRYDDIDFVQGDDMIFGGSGNDILHGQRGGDKIYGDEGEDEIYGELGNDELHGGNGSDIILGDIGYVVRRYVNSTPILKRSGAWKKDIVLEEIGLITKIQRLSEKFIVGSIDAEAIAAASLLFIATAYNSFGEKHVDPVNGEWYTDMFTFDLEPAHDDNLFGDNGDDGKSRQAQMCTFTYSYH